MGIRMTSYVGCCRWGHFMYVAMACRECRPDLNVLRQLLRGLYTWF